MKTIRIALTLMGLLLLIGISTFAQSFAGEDPKVNYALNLSQKITDDNRMVADLQSAGKSQLPVGIPANVGGFPVVVCVDSAKLTPRGALFSAYACIDFPQTNRKLAFAAKDIAFNPGGIGGSSQAKLMLISEVRFPVFNNVDLHLLADGSNYVEWDCNGFKNVHLKGEFVFNRELIVPDSLIDDGVSEVKATFEVTITDPKNFLVTTSISPFTLPTAKELSFSVYELTADFSDVASPPNAQFPSAYQQAFAGDLNLWRGFYVKRVAIALPPFLAGKNGRKTVEATDFLVDDQGISGTLAAKNILSMGESVSSWPISVNDVYITLLQSKLIGGGLGGGLNIPFLGGDSLNYKAIISENEAHGWDYRFGVELPDNRDLNMPLGGTMTLNKNSLVEFGRINGKTFGRALLNGNVNINQPVLNVEGVRFEGLELITETPYVVAGRFDFACNQATLGNFPISFSEIGLQAGGGKFGLTCMARLNIMNASDNGSSVGVKFYARAAVVEKTLTDDKGIEYKKHSFEFAGIDINKIAVDINISTFKVKGSIEILRDDPVYNNVFIGNLSLTMPVLKDPVTINAIFGSQKHFRYFHFDVYAPLGKVPVYPPALYITGVLGGVSYHMIKPENSNDKPDLNVFNAANKGDGVDVMQKGMIASQAGYIPDSTTALHLVAGVTMASQSEKSFNGNAILEMAFRTGGGLKFIQFTGVGYFLSPVQPFDISLPEFQQSAPIASSGANPQAAFWTRLKVVYDNDNHSFHANLLTYLNIANVIKGIDNGMVGEAVIHFDPKDWYIYVGRPSKPMGVDIAHVAQSQSYFMMGTQIESIPPPPREVQEILGETNLDIGGALDAYATGRGIAFGARIKVGLDVTLTPFFASIQAGAGTDIMIRQYNGVQCKGGDGPIGWNGWYATGQAYAYLQARAGIKVGRKSFNIFSAGLAALLQAKLPNPSWFKGEFGGRFSVLCGAVKGNFKIRFTIGEECELVTGGSELGDIKVIEDMKPDDRLTGVDVFAYPQVSFNVAVEQEMRMMNMEDKMESYRIKLDECGVYNGPTPINSTLQWNSSNDVVSVNTADILPPQQSLRFVVNVHWEKKVNGAWQTMMNDDGTAAKESKSVIFITGDAPDNIPESNVAYSYPTKEQYNFYPKEYGQGYMQLKKGQPYLFTTNDANGKYNLMARFTPLNGTAPVEKTFTYDEANRTINYVISPDMSLGTIYKLDFVKRPTGDAANDRNRAQQTQTSGDNDNSVSVTSNNLNGTITQNLEQNLYNSYFRTSTYAAFSDKWNELNSWQDVFNIATGNLYVIAKRSTARETFDHLEMVGKDELTPALVQTAALPSPGWYSNIQHPLLYELYGSSGLKLNWRDEKDKGVGPLKAVNWRNVGGVSDYSLTTDDVQNSYANAIGGQLQLEYYLSWYAFQDFIDLRNAAAFQFISMNGNVPEATRRLLSAQNYTDLLPGEYPVQIQYTLPGTHKVTTTKVIPIKF